MARYDRDFDRARPRGRGFGGEFGFRTRPGREEFEGGYGGMRSDAGGNWRSFEGEEGWLGAGGAGYPGGDTPYGQFVDYGQDFNARPRGGQSRGRFMGSSPRGRGSFSGGYASGISRYDEGGAGRGGRNDMRASELMTENPECVTPDTSVSEVAQKMRDLDVGIIPVVDSAENRRLRGVITDRDIAIRVVAEGRSDARVADCMTDKVETVNKNDSVRNVLGIMRREQVRRVPVTDRDGRLVGIIAQADLATEYAGEDHGREHAVQEAIEEISEPAQPERFGGRGRR